MIWPWQRDRIKLQNRIVQLETINKDWEQRWDRRNETRKSQPNYHVIILYKSGEMKEFDSASSWEYLVKPGMYRFIMPYMESRPYENEYLISFDSIKNISIEAIPNGGES